MALVIYNYCNAVSENRPQPKQCLSMTRSREFLPIVFIKSWSGSEPGSALSLSQDTGV